MMSLFLTDLYYQRLPFVQIVILTIICSIFTVLTEMNAEQIIYSFGVMSHLYGLFLPVLFTVAFALSKGKLIGGGDVLLALPVAILLPWQCVLAVLWLASVLALLSYASVIASEAKQSSRYVLLAGLLRLKPRNDKGQNRNDRARKTPFGSFLIIATLVVLFMVEPLVNFF
jgi:Flp pilus assembly protein protease CpaA